MADVNANIRINVDAKGASAQLRAMQQQIQKISQYSAVQTQNSDRINAYNKAVVTAVNMNSKWAASMVPLVTQTDAFNQSLERGTASMGQLSRGIASQIPGLSKKFKAEADLINRTAQSNVQQLRTQYVQLGQVAGQSAMALKAVPVQLQTVSASAMVAAQRMAIFNKMLDVGATKMINWGKNTQWAGRQLMVGFTVPLTLMGAASMRAFRELDESRIAFKRVYGDLNTTTAAMEENLEAVEKLGREYAKYGVSVAEVVGLGADVAAIGFQGADLTTQTEQTLRLATLGMMEYGAAMDAVVSITTAFDVASKDLAYTIDFLNVVENETILTMEDMAAAIPRVAPVVKGLGGDIQDLAVMMTAMREGGVTAEQAANALKSGLGRMINPTKAAKETMAEFGISLQSIVDNNKGDLMGMVNELGQALSTLSDFEQQQSLEKIFGKYQYARLGALFKNIAKEGSQAQKSMDLTAMSVEDLAEISEKEIGKIEEATSTKFQKSIEELQYAIAPIGELFMKVLLPVVNGITSILDKFNELGPGAKQAITYIVGGLGAVVPILIMAVGLFGNLAGNVVKGIKTLLDFRLRLMGAGDAAKYMTSAERDAISMQNSLAASTAAVAEQMSIEKAALQALNAELAKYISMVKTIPVNPIGAGGAGMVGPRAPLRRAHGGKVPGRGNTDKVPALLTPGESVVTKSATKRFGPVINAMNTGKIGRFAKGVIDVGGTQFTGNFLTERSRGAVQRVILEQDPSTQQALLKVLNEIDSNTQITAKEIQRQAADRGVALQGVEKKYSAPSNIQAQTRGMSWDTLEAEQKAIRDSVQASAEYWEVNEEQLKNLTRTQASHVDSTRAYVDGVKVWQADNLQSDLGAINNYLNRIAGMDLEILRAHGHIATISKRTGLSMEVVEKEIIALQKGMHPATAEAASVAKNLAIIDDETAKAAVTAKQTRTSLGLTAKGGYQAAPAAAAIAAREQGDYYGTLAGRSYTDGAAKGMGVRSPSVIAEKQVNDYAAGMAKGNKTAIKIARTEGKAMGMAYTQGVARGLDPKVAYKKAKGLVRQMDKAGMTQTQQTRTLRRLEESRARGARGAGTSTAGPSPAVSKAIETNAKVMAQTIARSTGPIQQSMNGFNRAIMNGAAKVGAAMSKAQAYLQGDGGRKLGRAAGGLTSGLMGLTMAASFAGGEVGEMANAIMPATMALFGLTMILPLLKSPIGALGIAAAASVATVLLFKKRADDANKASAMLAESMVATSKTMDGFAEAYGTQSAVSKARDQDSVKFGINKKDLTKAQEVIESEFGKNLKDSIQSNIMSVGKGPAIQSFANSLAQAVAQGVLTPSEAKAVARRMGEAIGDETFFPKVNGKLTELIGPNGKNLLTDPLSIYVKVGEENQKVLGTFNDAIQDLDKQYSEFFDWKMGDAAAFVNPIYGAINAINKLTLGWDNWIGGVARSSRGLLNEDDFEGFETRVKNLGSVAGNIAASQQENISAATSQLEGFNKEYDKLDKKKKRDANEELRFKQLPKLIEKGEAALKELNAQQVENQKQIESMFVGLDENTRTTFMDGQRASLQLKFEDDPLTQEVVSTIQGKIENQELEVVLNTALAGDLINPNALNWLLGSEGENQAKVDVTINTIGASELNKLALMASGINDPELQKEAQDTILENDMTTYNKLEKQRDKQLNNLLDQFEWYKDTAEDMKMAPYLVQDLENALETGDLTPIINALEAMGEQIPKAQGMANILRGIRIDLENNIEGDPIPQALREARVEFLGLKDELDGDELDIDIDYKGMSAGALANVNKDLNTLSMIPQEINEMNGIDGFSDPQKLYNYVAGLDAVGVAMDKVSMKKAILTVVGYDGEKAKAVEDRLDSLGYSLKEFAKLDDVTKIAIMAAIDLELEVQSKIDLANATIDAERVGSFSSGASTGAWMDLQAALPQLQQVQNFLKDFVNTSKTGGGTTPEPEKEKGGGSDEEVDGWEKYLENLIDTSRIFNDIDKVLKNMNKKKKGWFNTLLKGLAQNKGIAQQLRAMGLSESLIADIAGLGAEEAQKVLDAFEGKGGKKKQKLAQQLFNDNFIDESINQIEADATRENYRPKVEKILKDLGIFSAEAVEAVMGNSELLDVMMNVPPKAKGQWAEINKIIINIVENLDDAGDETEEFDAAVQQLNDSLDYMRSQFDAAEQAAEDGAMAKWFDDTTKANEGLIDSLEESTGIQIENGYDLQQALERQIYLTEKLIEVEQDKIDKKKEEIDDLNRLNELNNQRISDLRREQEMVNRQVEVLNRQLENISDQEESINDTYDKRVDALNQVAAINDYLMSQQEQQISMGEAISSGDIYAAAQAAEEMRQSQVEEAQRLQEEAMQEGRENAINSITSENGLDRIQLEEQINNLQEINYQTGLEIRDLEDENYNRNLLIRDLNNEIYNINEDLIEPLTTQKESYESMVEDSNDLVDWETQRVEVAGQTRREFEAQADALERQVAAAESLKNGFKYDPNFGSQVDNINNLANGLKDSNGEPPTLTPDTKYSRADASGTMGIINWPDYVFMNRGGIAKGTDVVPAMLTPGEFIMSKATVDKYGVGVMNAMNARKFTMPSSGQKIKPMTQMSGGVYNSYSVAVNATTNASPDDIASVVVGKIRQIESRGIRS